MFFNEALGALYKDNLQEVILKACLNDESLIEKAKKYLSKENIEFLENGIETK